MKVVITGIGIVSPAGIGKEALWDALVQGRSCIAPIERLNGAYEGAEVKGFSFESNFEDRRFRRAALVSRFALVAAKLALKDAGFNAAPGGLEGMRTGVVSGITHGALNFSCEFHKSYMEEGPAGASPALFSDSVLNATTGSLSLAFSARGPSHTLIGDSPVGLQALRLGSMLIASKKTQICMVAASEVFEEILAFSYSRLGHISGRAPSFNAGEGSAVLILESLEAALERGAMPLAEVGGCSVSTGKDLVSSLTKTCADSLKNAGLSLNSVTHVITRHPYWLGDYEEKAFAGLLRGKSVSSTSACIGECFGLSSLTDIAMAAIAVNKGKIFDSMCLDSPALQTAGATPLEPLNVLVASTGIKCEAGCAVLKRI